MHELNLMWFSVLTVFLAGLFFWQPSWRKRAVVLETWRWRWGCGRIFVKWLFVSILFHLRHQRNQLLAKFLLFIVAVLKFQRLLFKQLLHLCCVHKTKSNAQNATASILPLETPENFV